MSSAKNIVLRVQTSEGTRRINVCPGDSIKSVYDKVHNAFSLRTPNFSLYKNRNNKDEIPSSKSTTVASKCLKHGDILYLQPHDGISLFPSQQSTSGSSTSQSTPSGDPGFDPQEGMSSTGGSPNNFVEDEVDKSLWAMDGKILRKRDQKLCHHNANGCCIHCSPLEPYDEAYLREHNIKHLSFHSYLRKLTGGVDRGKFVALENTSCRIKPGCKDHPPWPKGICSKCQPSAVTLNRQAYRHVDNVVFENPEIVERFLEYWRTSGHQRMGYLYGKYEVHGDVPLGIRATVAVIYEPPQETARDKIVLLPDERENLVNELAQKLGLQKVGWIFTDLIAEDVSKGTVKHIRNINTHFLSAQECIMAGHLQNLHPNPCKFSATGHFGSKFATVCVTGDSTNQVHMEGYAVSAQCMSLVRDNCLIPTKDMPQLGYVPESSDKQYVPDVYYKEKDSYGNEVSKLARPLPVEYLLVDVPASTPMMPVYTFRSDSSKTPFPIENRLLDKHIQDFNALSSYFHQFTPDQFLFAVSDFHVLLYIATMEMLPMKHLKLNRKDISLSSYSADQGGLCFAILTQQTKRCSIQNFSIDFMGPLLQAVKDKDAAGAADWSRSEHWATVEQLMMSSRDGAHMDGIQSEWTCPHCTFLNPSHLTACDMCSLPRRGVSIKPEPMRILNFSSASKTSFCGM